MHNRKQQNHRQTDRTVVCKTAVIKGDYSKKTCAGTLNFFISGNKFTNWSYMSEQNQEKQPTVWGGTDISSYTLQG